MERTWTERSGDCRTGIRWVICGLAPEREAISMVKPASRNPRGRTIGNFFHKRQIPSAESQAISIMTQ